MSRPRLISTSTLDASAPVTTTTTTTSIADEAESQKHPVVGGKVAIFIFVCTLLAFVAESQLTQYVESNLGYRQPFFIFYIVHSSFLIIFPLHLIYLIYLSPSRPHTVHELSQRLVQAIHEHLSPEDQPYHHAIDENPDSDPDGVLDPLSLGVCMKGNPGIFTSVMYILAHMPPETRIRFVRIVVAMTCFVTVPALLWFGAISLASVTDVTAIWNTNAFFAYVFTVKLFGLSWEPRRLLAVCIATLGTMLVVYSGSTSSSSPPSDTGTPQIVDGSGVSEMNINIKPSAPLLGDLLTLVASVGYGLYQVMYKKYAALPSDPELTADENAYIYERLSSSLRSDAPASLSQSHPRPPNVAEDDDACPIVNPTSATTNEKPTPPPPFGLHPNLITSLIGLSTLIIGPVFIPILHMTSLEPFILPPSTHTTLSILLIAITGVLFNAGLMVLLGLWGPIVVSVGNLLTIVLVFVVDEVFGAGGEKGSVGGMVGSGVIVLAFGVLVWDMVVGKRGR